MKPSFFGACMVAACVLAQGCAMNHTTVQGSTPKMVRVCPEEGQKPLGLIHVETWAPTLFCIKLGYASLSASQDEVVRQAEMLGADAVVYPRNHVEVRMPFPLPFIIGWNEYHVWGMAVKK
jgi:hypothetical protein